MEKSGRNIYKLVSYICLCRGLEMKKRYRCLGCNKKYVYRRNMMKHSDKTKHPFTDDGFWNEVLNG